MVAARYEHAQAATAMSSRLIGRYMRREIASAVLFVLLGFLALFAFFDVINELDELGKGAYRLQHALVYVGLGLPNRAYELMPIAALIGAIYALAQFAQHSEFTAMRAAGLGRSRALLEVGLVGLVFALVTLMLGEVVAPQSEKLARQIRLSAMGTAVVGQFRSGIWIKDAARAPDGRSRTTRFINIRELEPDGTLQGVQVYEFDQQFRLIEVLNAKSARYGVSAGWQLYEVETIMVDPRAAGAIGETLVPDPSGKPKALAAPGPLAAERLVKPQARWDTELTPDIFNVALVAPERMAALGLYQYIRHLQDNRQATDRYVLALWKKLMYPLAVVVMMALALPFAYLQVRAGGIGYKVFVGIMLGVTFHLLNGLFSHLGLLNTWPAWVSAGLPSALAMMLALGMLAWVDRVR
jgi:lipopolysaccharide export system permease protein